MTEEEGVSYEELQELLRAERRSNKLATVTEGFWAKLQIFLRGIEAEFRAAQAEDPFDRRVMMMTDRIKNARHAAESLWTLRERKLAMLALAHVRDGGKPEGLTSKEASLYAGLLERLREGRREVFAGTAAEDDYSEATPKPPASRPAVRRPAKADQEKPVKRDEPPLAQPPEVEPDEPRPIIAVPPDTPEDDVVTIRALGDLPPFVGPDMQTYQLKDGDLATVPPGIADLLVKRGKAVLVETATA